MGIKISDLKIGDIVKFKNKRGDNWNVLGQMDEFMGNCFEVIKINTLDFNVKEPKHIARANYDTRAYWYFSIEDVESIIDDLDGDI